MGSIRLLIAHVMAAAAAQPPDDFRIISDVRLVLVDVSVRGDKGQPLSGIPREAFHILDNGRPQPITAFASEDAPVTAGIIADMSGSMKHKRGELRMAVAALLRENNERDEVFLVTFNDTVRSYPIGADIIAKIDSSPVAGRTALFDGIRTGLLELPKGTRERKTLIVISDGGDNASESTRRGIFDLVQRSEATIYAIGILDEGEKDQNPGFLRDLASLTGGDAYIDIPLVQLPDVCRRIARDIRSRYLIGFRAADATREESHRIRIKVDTPQPHRVWARKSYLALPLRQGSQP